MRIVAGKFARKQLVVPKHAEVRPTSDRVRESLFQRLGSLDGQTVLDLFAGSGAIGLEALSRGAKKATFVECSAPVLRTLQRNIANCGVEAVTQVVRSDALRWLARTEDPFDLIFLDPPYGQATKLIGSLNRLLANVMHSSSLVIAESSYRQPLDLVFTVQDERRYGETLVRCYRP